MDVSAIGPIRQQRQLAEARSRLHLHLNQWHGSLALVQGPMDRIASRAASRDRRVVTIAPEPLGWISTLDAFT
ncbi:hypothetical protein L107_03416 [Cyanobium sp. Copco_Reservoir_LC18]|nr:hypothetical protein L107_03416 [Cyanobium sp. Copco_Reservoir_LC18]